MIVSQFASLALARHAFLFMVFLEGVPCGFSNWLWTTGVLGVKAEAVKRNGQVTGGF